MTFHRSEIVVTLVATSPTSVCPTCQQPANRVHSRYWRRLADGPLRRIPVRLRLHVRRFFCRNRQCRRKVFAERLGDVAKAAARRTRRLGESLRDSGLANGGEQGSRLARRLGMVASPDSLLRLIREGKSPEAPNPKVIGVDEWAKRKGRPSGAIVVDRERHRVVDLREEATADAFAEWLKGHPGVAVIRRGRGGAFAEGGREGAPEAIQIADRWHLLKNRGDAVEEYLTRIHRQLPAKPNSPKALPVPSAPRTSEGSAPSPTRLSRSEQERRRRRARRLKRYQAVVSLHQKGMSARQIALSLDLDRQTVSKYLRAESFPEIGPRAKRPSLLDPFRTYLQKRWDEGCHNAMQLFRELQERGFAGQRSIVADVVTRLRQQRSGADAALIQQVIATAPSRRMSPRQVRWAFVRKWEELPSETRNVLAPFLAEHAEARLVYELAQCFGEMVRERRPGDLEEWLKEARRGPRELRSFAVGIERDRGAVEAARTYEWSNGQTEGQVNRVKLAKRAMFGRANFDLLRRRVLEAVERPSPILRESRRQHGYGPTAMRRREPRRDPRADPSP